MDLLKDVFGQIFDFLCLCFDLLEAICAQNALFELAGEDLADATGNVENEEVCKSLNDYFFKNAIIVWEKRVEKFNPRVNAKFLLFGSDVLDSLLKVKYLLYFVQKKDYAQCS